MFEIGHWQDFLLVAVGAISGASLRFWLGDFLQLLLPRKHWGTFLINISAAFGLGLVIAFEAERGSSLGEALSSNRASQLFLLIAVGFLGSLSTFSTFVLEVLMALRDHLWREAFLLTLGSICVGLLAAYLGLVIGNG